MGAAIKLSTIFLACQAIGFIGISGASLVLTTVAFDAGQASGHPATAAGTLLALIAIFAVLSAPYGPLVVRRFGLRRTYEGICLGYCATYVIAGGLMIVGGPHGLIAFCVAPLAGIATGWFGPASQQILVAYSPPGDRARLMAKMAMSLGIACTAGLPLIGAISDRRGPGLALVAAGLLFVPQVVVCVARPPITEVARPQRVTKAWSQAVGSLRSKPELRRAVVLAGTMAVFVVPMQSMMAPMVLKIGMTGAAAAGLCLGFMSLGGALTPIAVKKLGESRPNLLHVGALTYAIAGVILVAAGVAVVLVAPQVAFTILCALMIGFGAMRMSGQAFMRGLAGTQGDPSEAQHSLATFMLFVLACVPFGVLAWGLLLDHLGPAGCLIVTGAAGFTAATFMGRQARTRHPAAQ